MLRPCVFESIRLVSYNAPWPISPRYLTTSSRSAAVSRIRSTVSTGQSRLSKEPATIEWAEPYLRPVVPGIAAAQPARWAKARGQKIVSINGRRRRKISTTALANIRSGSEGPLGKVEKAAKDGLSRSTMDYFLCASGMIALTGIVFSLTFVTVQFSATAYSPRLVLWISRDPVISHSLGVFTATFLYALTALAWVDRSGSGRVPFVGVGVTAVLLILSIVMFISLIQRVSMLQVTRMLIFTGNKGREVIEKLYPPLDTPATPYSPDLLTAGSIQTLVHHGHPMAIQRVDVLALMRVAKEAACVIEMTVSVGDTVLESTPMLRVGRTGPIPEEALRSAIELGTERTFDQDPKYAIRLLVDIAIRAVSPAVNDPTTAVQALNEIEDLLLRLGRRRLEIGTYRDATEKPKLLLPYPSWEDFLRLAFAEIRFYGASSVQVMRRIRYSSASCFPSCRKNGGQLCSIGKHDCNPRWRRRSATKKTFLTHPTRIGRVWEARAGPRRHIRIMQLHFRRQAQISRNRAFRRP